MAEELAKASKLEVTADCRQQNMEECGYPYKFSVVTAVYNVEPFLSEAIDSLLDQTIGFRENIQLILVDDGSKDTSGEICDEYQRQYPKNIIVIHKENGGVASARNEGLKYVEGRYVNFMDSDDGFTPNTFENVYRFYSEHEDETDIVTIPLKFFDAVTGNHWQNFKFDKGCRIIDLLSEYNASLMFVNASFFRKESVQHLKFDGRLVCGEDIKFILQVLASRMKLGVLNTCSYRYRRRSIGEESLVQSSKKKKGWYFDYFTCLTFWAREFFLNQMGYYPYFAQYVIACDLQWRIFNLYEPADVLNEDEVVEYQKVLCEAYRSVEDKLIMEQRQVWKEYKCLMLQMKYGHLPAISFSRQNAVLYFGNTNIAWVSDMYTKIDFISIESGMLTIEGYSMFMGVSEEEPIEMLLKINEDLILCETVERDVNQYRLGQLLFRGVAFRHTYAYDDAVELYMIQIYCRLRGHALWKRDVRFGQFSPVGQEYQNAYYYKDHRILSYKQSTLYFKKCGFSGIVKKKLLFVRELMRTKRISDKKAALFHIVFPILHFFKRKPIWLLSDRISRADDNGEVLFAYLNSIKNLKARTYFLLSPNAPDIQKLKGYGKVISPVSFKHKMLWLLSDLNISSSADDFLNPFQDYYKPYRSLLQKSKFVFLQHGITKDDLSGWLNRYNKNILGFVTAAKPEYESILSYPYYYSKKHIWMTGFPRHDRLYHDEQKIITFMPTWRSYLFIGGPDIATGERKLDPRFRESQYYKTYNLLLHNQYLLDCAQKYGYYFNVMLHPAMHCLADMFNGTNIDMLPFSKSYCDIFAQSDLIVTDYSSTAFDFAYLRKPVVYFQFDKEDFFSGKHVYKAGYFDYERDGFGEVEYDLESVVNRIIEYMKSKCLLKDIYRKRIDNFFAFRDQNNCQRVYEKLIELDE